MVMSSISRAAPGARRDRRRRTRSVAVRQHHEDDDAQQDVEGDAELDQEREARRAQEGHEGDPVVDHEQADDLERSACAGRPGRRSRPAWWRCRSVPARRPWSRRRGHAAAGDEGQHDERGGGDQRGGDVDERPGSRAIRESEPLARPRRTGITTALTTTTTAAAASSPASCRCTPRTTATKPEGSALDGHHRTITARIEASHRIATAQTSTVPAARVSAEK